MPRGDQISRQWRILQELEKRRAGISVPELAAKLESNVRSVYRDMQALELAGFPIYNDKEDGVLKWKFVDGYRQKLPLPFELTELMALFIARGHLKAFDGTVFSDSLSKAFEKISSTLKPEAHSFLDQVSKTFRIGIGGRKNYHKHQHTIDIVNKAVLERRTLEIVYRENEKSRRIDPYHVWFMSGTIYIVAFCHRRNELRLFVLDRIIKASLTDEHFETPSDFSMDDFTGDRFRVSGGDGVVDVRIRFSPNVVGYIKEWTWHPSQIITNEKKGAIILEMRVEGLSEVKNWVLSFGSRAKVLAPKKLADEILKESRQLTKLYVN